MWVCRNCLSYQTCLIPIDSLLEAFDVFPEFPSLEYKMWHSLAVKISTVTIMEHIIYQVRKTSASQQSATPVTHGADTVFLNECIVLFVIIYFIFT